MYQKIIIFTLTEFQYTINKMNTPTLYKKKDINTVRDRETSSLTSNEKTQVTNTLSKFFELFKLKHL